MFGFRGKKRAALVKELVETKLRLRGQDELQLRLFVKSLGTLTVMSLPEGTIVAIVEAAVVGQSKGAMLRDVLMRQEGFRRMSGSDPVRFESILKESVGTNPAEALLHYCQYRLDIETRRNPQSFVSHDELLNLVPIAYQEIRRW